METAQMEEALVSLLEPVMQKLDRLASEQTQLRLRLPAPVTQSSQLSMQPDAESPNGSGNNQHGLCQDDSCESCMSQTQEVAQAAYEKGRADYADHLEQLWLLRGGEPLRDSMVRATQEGQALWEKADLEAQEIKISA